MSKIVLSIPKLGVTKKGWEKNKEIYVVSFSADLRLTDKPKITDSIAAYNETLPNIIPEIADESALKYIITSVSNIFPRIRHDQPVSLSGSGIILYPNYNPNGLLAAHLMIIESDKGARDIGKFLTRLFSNDKVEEAIESLTTATNVTQPLIGLLMSTIINQVPRALSRNKDDIIFAHSHSGMEYDNYGAEKNQDYTDYELSNDLCYCTLRVRVNKN